MIEHDDIRSRLRSRFEALELPLTGKWLTDKGLGKTTVRNFVDGLNHSITIETISKLAEPLKTTEKWLLFGNDDQPVSESMLREMAEIAAEEIQAGMRIEEIRSAVASALRDQLALHLTVGAIQSSSDEPSAPGKSVQSPAPTKAGGQAKSRSA